MRSAKRSQTDERGCICLLAGGQRDRLFLPVSDRRPKKGRNEEEDSEIVKEEEQNLKGFIFISSIFRLRTGEETDTSEGQIVGFVRMKMGCRRREEVWI